MADVDRQGARGKSLGKEREMEEGRARGSPLFGTFNFFLGRFPKLPSTFEGKPLCGPL